MHQPVRQLRPRRAIARAADQVSVRRRDRDPAKPRRARPARLRATPGSSRVPAISRTPPEQTVREAVEEGIGGVLAAKKWLDEVYAEYADENADFDKLAAE